MDAYRFLRTLFKSNEIHEKCAHQTMIEYKLEKKREVIWMGWWSIHVVHDYRFTGTDTLAGAHTMQIQI